DVLDYLSRSVIHAGSLSGLFVICLKEGLIGVYDRIKDILALVGVLLRLEQLQRYEVDRTNEFFKKRPESLDLCVLLPKDRQAAIEQRVTSLLQTDLLIQTDLFFSFQAPEQRAKRGYLYVGVNEFLPFETLAVAIK